MLVLYGYYAKHHTVVLKFSTKIHPDADNKLYFLNMVQFSSVQFQDQLVIFALQA